MPRYIIKQDRRSGGRCISAFWDKDFLFKGRLLCSRLSVCRWSCLYIKGEGDGFHTILSRINNRVGGTAQDMPYPCYHTIQIQGRVFLRCRCRQTNNRSSAVTAEDRCRMFYYDKTVFTLLCPLRFALPTLLNFVFSYKQNTEGSVSAM